MHRGPIAAFVCWMVASASNVAALQTSPPAKRTNKGFEVQGIGTFSHAFKVDFSTLSSFPDDFIISTDTVGPGTSPYARVFKQENVVLRPGKALSLLVQPDIEDGAIPSGEFSTAFDDILYGSVRTVAKASTTPGVCHGFFSYLNDNQETDIEILTKNLTKVWFTNQALVPGTDETSTHVPAPASIATAFHEYRVDWLQNRTIFYIDGVKRAVLRQNVPTEPTRWIWNSWAQVPSPEPSNIHLIQAQEWREVDR